MSENKPGIENILKSAEMSVDPSPVHMREVHDRMMTIARGHRPLRRRSRTFVTGGFLLAGAAVAIAGTRTGRNLVRWIFTPIQPAYVMDLGIKGEETTSEPSASPGPLGTGSGFKSSTHSVAMRAGPGAQPFTLQEEEAERAAMRQVGEIEKAGGGRLYGLIEGPGFVPGESISTVYTVEYMLRSGETMKIGADPRTITDKQRVNMHLDEITRLYDSGAGQLIAEQPFPLGLGGYLIRFTLSDGSMVDVKACFPPGPRAEREAIIGETRELKKALRFSVANPSVSPGGDVLGTLKYKLADGRIVSFSEKIPPEALTPDHKHVVLPDTGQTVEIEGAPLTR